MDNATATHFAVWHTRSWHDGVAKADAADDDDNVSSLLALCLLYVEYHTERRSRRIWHRFHSLVRTLISPLALYVGATVAILMLGVCIRWGEVTLVERLPRANCERLVPTT